MAMSISVMAMMGSDDGRSLRRSLRSSVDKDLYLSQLDAAIGCVDLMVQSAKAGLTRC